jgi:hypothetical protein
MAGLGRKKEEKKPKKLSKSFLKFSKSCQTFRQTWKKLTKKRKQFFLKISFDFGKLGMILKIGYEIQKNCIIFKIWFDFENWIEFPKLSMNLKIGYNFEN